MSFYNSRETSETKKNEKLKLKKGVYLTNTSEPDPG